MKTPLREVALALVIGIVVGWFAAVRFAPERPRGRGPMIDRFARELKLTPEQKEKMGHVFDARRKQFDAMRAEIRPRFEAIRASSRAEIRAILDEKQAVKFDEIEKKAEARRKERWSRGPA